LHRYAVVACAVSSKLIIGMTKLSGRAVASLFDLACALRASPLIGLMAPAGPFGVQQRPLRRNGIWDAALGHDQSFPNVQSGSARPTMIVVGSDPNSGRRGNPRLVDSSGRLVR
jgi:hypothetical protein